MRWKTRGVVIGLLATIALTAQGAAALSAMRADPGGDAVDINGENVTDPRVDVLSVSIDNTLDVVELTIEVDEVVPFVDDAWRDGALFVYGALRSPRSHTSWDWHVSAPAGSPVGILARVDVDAAGCTTDVRATATAYVLTARDACAFGLPRSIEWAAVVLAFDEISSAIDIAPDQSIDGDQPVYFPAVGTSVAPEGPDRLAGTDRTLTAIALSQDSFGTQAADAVVLAADHAFPDALAGGPLAAYLNAPLLLTGRDGLDPRTSEEIQRVLRSAGSVFVLGGTAALSDRVMSDLKASGFSARRVAGVDRFATAAAIADVVVDSTERGYVTVLLADGRTFTDALLAAAAAPAQLGVVLLTDGTTMPESTATALATRLAKRFAIGAAAAAAAPDAESIIDDSPSALSVKVAARLAPVNGSVGVATQDGFPDALAGGPHIAGHRGPLLLTESNALSTATGDAIAERAQDLRRVVIYGGTAAIGDAVEVALASRMEN